MFEFLDIVDSGLQTGKPGKKKDVYNSDLYDDWDEEEV